MTEVFRVAMSIGDYIALNATRSRGGFVHHLTMKISDSILCIGHILPEARHEAIEAPDEENLEDEGK